MLLPSLGEVGSMGLYSEMVIGWVYKHSRIVRAHGFDLRNSETKQLVTTGRVWLGHLPAEGRAARLSAETPSVPERFAALAYRSRFFKLGADSLGRF